MPHRLDLQHWLIKDGFYGGRELVFAPVDLAKQSSERVQILDSACGTGRSRSIGRVASAHTVSGIWSVELAKKYPNTTQFTLVDYNTGPCKHRFPELPDNAKLAQFNLLTDFDKHPEWKNHFDLIHQRLLVFAFPAEQWKSVLKGYYDSIKPGGYIQLEEFEPAEAKMGPHMETLKRLIQEISVPRGIHPESIAKDVHKWLEEAGFVDIQVERVYMPFVEEIKNEPVPNAVQLWGKNTVAAIAAPALKMGKISQEDHAELMKGSQEEFANPRPEHTFPMVSFVARVSSPPNYSITIDANEAARNQCRAFGMLCYHL